MDGRGFFLGLIAAVVLFLLWKNESRGMTFNFPGIGPQPSNGSGTGGCAGCGGPGGCAGCGDGQPAYASAPSAQSGYVVSPGQITPGTPPLQSVAGVGSFYAESGPTPDSSFTNYPARIPVNTSLTVARTQTAVHNVVSSPTTPSTIVPTRAVAAVPPYSGQGFQQRYNVAGVPRTAFTKLGYVQ